MKIKDLARKIKKNKIEDVYSYVKNFKKYNDFTLRELDQAVKLSKEEA